MAETREVSSQLKAVWQEWLMWFELIIVEPKMNLHITEMIKLNGLHFS